MSEPDATQTNEAGFADVLPTILPELRAITRQGWLHIGLAAVLTSVAAAMMRYWIWPDHPVYALFALFCFVVAAQAIYQRVQRRHEAILMPLLAQSLGLTYSQQGQDFAKSLPPRLLPQSGSRTGTDLITGHVAGHEVAFAEVECATTGKHKRTLFRGVVAKFHNAAALPPFFMADESNSGRMGFWYDGISTAGLVKLDSRNDSAGKTFGIWASGEDVAQDPALAMVVQVFLDLAAQLGPGAGLFSASSDGTVIHIAMTHKRDLFSIGGLFARDDALLPQIRLAFEDLTMPLLLAAKLIEAEALAAKTRTAGRTAPAALPD